MGIQRTIRFPGHAVPEWPSVTAKLVEAGESPVLRMIDGMPAFPDETPPSDWRELRIGLSGGMVTVKRTSDAEIACVTWGTGEPNLVASWNRLCEAFAVAGGGVIVE